MKKRFMIFFILFYGANLFAKVNLIDYSKGHGDRLTDGPIILHETKKSGIKDNIYLRKTNGSLVPRILSGDSLKAKNDRALIPIDVNISYTEGTKASTTKAKYCLRLTNSDSITENMIYTLLTQQEKDNFNKTITNYNPLVKLIGTKTNPWNKLIINGADIPGSNYKIQGYINKSFNKSFYDDINEDYTDGKICVVANNGENIYIIAEPYAWTYGGGYPEVKSLDPRFAIDYEAIPNPPSITEIKELMGKLQVVNEWYGDGGDSQIYTQLIGGDVKTKLTFSPKLTPKEAESITSWYYNNNIQFLIRLIAENSYVGTYSIDEKEVKQTSFENLLKNGVIDLGNFTVKNIINNYFMKYQNLHFEVYVRNITGSKPITREISNHFSARPANFRVNIPNSSTLIGGKEYYKNDTTISKIEALDTKGVKIVSYNVTLDANNELLDSGGRPVISNVITWDTKNVLKGQCVDNKGALLVPNKNNPDKSIIEFHDGVGFIFNGCKDNTNFLHGIINDKTCFFRYPDIGPTKITIFDNKFTKVDQDKTKYCGPAVNDDVTARFCLARTAHTDNRRENSVIWTQCSGGKLVNRQLYNCNAQLDVNFYRFKVSKLFADANILNSDGDMTYYSDSVYSSDGNKTFGLKNKDDYKNFKGANLNLIIRATLEDNSTAKLYTKNCYAKDVNLKLDYNDTGVKPNDFIFKRDLANGQDIYFYALDSKVTGKNDNPNVFKKVGDPYVNNGQFYIKSNSFLYGETNSTLKINLGREFNKAKDPKRVPSTRIIFDGNDTDGVEFYKSSSAIATSFGNFFYGRVFAPDYEFMISSLNDINIANIYYMAYCKNSCNDPIISSILSTDKHESFLPPHYYIFKNLNANSNLAYDAFNSKSDIEITPNVPNKIVKGIETIKIKYKNKQLPRVFSVKGYFDEKIDQISPKYLIYDEFYTPLLNTPNGFIFNTRFDRSSDGDWTGYGEEGNVLGIDTRKSEQHKRIGNRRIDW